MRDSKTLELVERLNRHVAAHEEWRTGRCLNLIPSENFGSSQMRRYLSTDLSNRYTARDHFYRGTRESDEIEALCLGVAKKLYHCKFADVRPLSGHTCSMIAFLSLLRPGNKVVTCPPRYGGYEGSSELGLGQLLRLRNLYFPYDPETMNIIPAETRSLLSARKPELTVFGSSFIPFPYKIREAIPDDYRGYKIYDGSHVMGLIAGGEFQNPLREGCGVLMGSTHKTLFGPQGGILLSNDEEVFEKITNQVYPGIVDNIHLNRVASLAYGLIELLRFGKRYASQVIRNSKFLAKSLNEKGIRVKCGAIGYTESHQVLLDYGKKRSVEIANRLESRNIIADVGVRLGTSEVTRRGMREPEMDIIADLIGETIRGKVAASATRLRVERLARQFGGLEYTLPA